MLKSHNCGELRLDHVGQEVALAGWVHRRRDHGGLIFIDLRDRSGLVQVVANPQVSPDAHENAALCRAEYVILVRGVVSRRPAGTENPNLPTGQVEVVARTVEVLSAARTPPFPIAEEQPVDESLRLRYRYLDLRRPKMRDNLLLRHRVIKFIRDYLDRRGFVEVETPILTKSTPEGARDYLVPSRLHPGRFYALPQSPQQMKQLLMVAGIEKYFQIARCFRDEDLRADRQPEFTQLDLEMSFVDQDDVLNLVEALMTELVRTVTPEFKVRTPFPRLTYQEIMDRYGTDHADLRFGLELVDVTDILKETQFQVFRQAAAAGGRIKGIRVPGQAGITRREVEELAGYVRQFGLGGLVSVAVEPFTGREGQIQLGELGIRSPAGRYLTEAELRALVGRFGAQAGDLILLGAGPYPVVSRGLAELREELGRRLGLADPNLLVFAWVVDFPAFEFKEQENRWDAVHHPFTAPRDEDLPYLLTDPGRVRAKQYDLICNGYELGGGSIRITNPEVQRQVFEIMGHTRETIERQFGHLLTAFEYGVPPHGGIAVGLDRLVAVLAREPTIREVIAFPKTKEAVDLLFGAPSEVSPEQLKELHIKVCLED